MNMIKLKCFEYSCPGVAILVMSKSLITSTIDQS